MRKKKSLQSSIEKIGSEVVKIIHFDNGEEKTFEGVQTNTIRVGRFTKFDCKDEKGRVKKVGVAHDRVLWFEVHP